MSRHKYHSTHVTYKCMNFDSRAERDRYIELECRRLRGEIAGLHRQVRFCIIPAAYGFREKQLKTKTKTELYCIEKAAYYTCDFCYLEKQDDGWVTVIEDCKSRYTRSLSDYVLRRKLMVHAIAERKRKNQEFAGYNIDIDNLSFSWFDRKNIYRCIFRESEPQRGNKETKITDR